ncbi:MAG TPA: GNAT family protein [Anoxybacillus sp.]|jgi:RimJ/RimL family protein N-acetyltransferase|nr:GNAT family protein [Anoxybacillus sp.]
MLKNRLGESERVQLCFYGPEHDVVLQTFYLPTEQEKFTALPTEVIDLSIQDENRYPVVILNRDTPVGFFVLHDGKDIQSFTNNLNAMLLRALSINYIHQGKGYAKKALQLLPKFVMNHFPHINEIVLAVNEKNLAARRLYEKSGFEDRGLRRFGKIGVQLILHYPLSNLNQNRIY